MVKKKVAKKPTRKKEEEKVITRTVSKKIKDKENKLVFWFLAIIVLIFAAFIVPYFFVEGSKHFDHSKIVWNIEEYDLFDVYHGRFLVLNGENLNYNIYLRNDPRENNVPTTGDFSDFKIGGYISVSSEIDTCKGEIARMMFDLGGFLRTGVGVQEITVGTTNTETAARLGTELIDCSTRNDRTIVILEKGESSVVQSKENPSCYTITVENCEDIQPIEKFMTKSVEDFRTKNPIQV